eukprot:GEMP01031101.1.p1 GENE.GEMP01031101.1~~GEMP01031101.1.p1  ORF type:complete len:617 (+),score=113.83 GEMP01031101.1:24-1874(+)
MSLELEHAIGCNRTFSSAAHLLPRKNEFIVSVGGCVLISSITDKHSQTFLSPKHDAFVTCLAVSPDGKFAASGQAGQNADVILWDLDERQLKFRFQEHDYGVDTLCFTHDSAYLVSCGCETDGRLLVYDCDKGLVIAWTSLFPKPTLQMIHGVFVKTVKRRYTSSYQLAACGGKHIQIWSLDTQIGEISGNQVAAAGKQQRDFTCIAFSADYELLYSGTTTGDVVVILMKNLVIQHYVSQCARNGVRSIVSLPFFDDGLYFITGGGDGTITLYTAPLGGTNFVDREQVRFDGSVDTMSLSEDAREILSVTSNGTVCRVKTKDLIYTTQSQNPAGKVLGVTFPHGVSDAFMSCSDDGSVTLWDGNNYNAKLECRERGASGFPVSCCGSLDILLAGYNDGKMRGFDTTGEMLWRLDNAHKKSVNCVELAQNVRFVVSGGADGDLRVWELRTRELISNLKEHAAPINGVQLFANDQFAATVSRDRCLLTWDLRAERRLTAHREKHGSINCLSLSGDQTSVVTAGAEKTLTYWDLRQADPVRCLQLSEELTTVAISPEDKFLATAGSDQLVKLWDFRMMKEIASGIGHSAFISMVAWSPDSKQIISAGEDHGLMVWNVYD